MKIRKILSLFLGMSVIISSSIIMTKLDSINTVATFNDLNTPIIIIDAGHGNFDGGAVANDGTVEKDINLKVALNLAEICRTNGLPILMVRKDDSSLEDDENGTIRQRKNSDLHNRSLLMQKYDNSIYVSIHMNKFSDSSVHGAQVFYSSKYENAKLLAKHIQDAVKYVQEDNNRVIKEGTRDTYLLHNAKCPAVIVECGFLSNPIDLENLKQDNYRSKLAFCIYLGILKYMNGV